MAQVMFTSADDLLAAYLSGEIDHHSAQMLRQQIDAELSARMPARLILDFGGVTFMDSSGIGLILAAPGGCRPPKGSWWCSRHRNPSKRCWIWPMWNINRKGAASMKAYNLMKISFYSRSVNDVSPAGAGGLSGQADPTVPELADMKTAVSEAVTNCIVHAYPQQVGLVYLTAALYEGGVVKITVTDRGVGIPDVEKAMQPMFTTGNPEERAGLGFAVMQSFMDKVRVTSTPARAPGE